MRQQGAGEGQGPGTGGTPLEAASRAGCGPQARRAPRLLGSSEHRRGPCLAGERGRGRGLSASEGSRGGRGDKSGGLGDPGAVGRLPPGRLKLGGGRRGLW